MRKTIFLISILLFNNILFSQESETVRIATYNVLNYPDNYSTRNPNLKKVIDEIDPDILVVQEMTSLFGVYTFLNEVLTPSFIAGPFIDGPDTDNAIFYKDSLITLISHIAIPTALRNISEFTLYHKFTLDTLKIYSVHLKASEGFEQQRLEEVTAFRSRTNALPLGTNFVVLGDFNIYTSSEPAYQKLIDQSTPGYFIDPLIAGTWHNNSSYASYHTQSTCNLSSCPNGGSNGGMDDRFDMIMVSQAVKDTGDITLLNSTYQAFGNDGQHFNKSINEPPFTLITQEIANALFNSSDHLPIFADFYFGVVNDVETIDPSTLSFYLYQNYPNPFNPSTKITFEMPYSTYTKIVLYDVLGREVSTLFEGEVSAGMNEIELNAKNLAGGIYFYNLISKDFVATKKFLILK
jgi:hypothetical protein